MAARRSSKTTLAPIKIDRAPRPDLVTRQELADILRVSDRYVERLIERNEIPYVRLGRNCLFWLSDIVAFLADRRVPTTWVESSGAIDF